MRRPGLLLVVAAALLVAACSSEGAPAALEGDQVPDEVSALPNLVGRALSDLGGRDGLLFELHRDIGIQQSVFVASETLEAGRIVAMEPAPGTMLADIDRWTLYISEGGPVIEPSDLPEDVRAFAQSLPEFSEDELLVERAVCVETDATDCDESLVYKSDSWLFGTSCQAVEVAYRTFQDGRYLTGCPGFVEGVEGGWSAICAESARRCDEINGHDG